MKRIVNGLELDIEQESRIIDLIISEVAGYQLDLNFKPGDTVIDIGANVGIVSCYLAKKYPFLNIEAYEPVPENVLGMLNNLYANQIHNVRLHNQAVSCDGRELELYGDLDFNSGGVSLYGRGKHWSVKSVAARNVISHNVRLLKIDCEGMEYEILTPDVLVKIQSIRGETHTIPGQDENYLLGTIYEYVPDVLLTTGEPLSIKAGAL